MTANVYLYPTDGPLDVQGITSFVSSRADVLRDPAGSDVYIIAGVPEAKAAYRRARLQDRSRFPYTARITVDTECVHVAQEFGDAPQLRSARALVSWILQHQPCRIEDEYGTDWTDRVAREGVGVLYPETLT
jgi:hypothetical protein